jgi:hypothetical protein
MHFVNIFSKLLGNENQKSVFLRQLNDNNSPLRPI